MLSYIHTCSITNKHAKFHPYTQIVGSHVIKHGDRMVLLQLVGFTHHIAVKAEVLLNEKPIDVRKSSPNKSLKKSMKSNCH
jgi:hypothetical protein